MALRSNDPYDAPKLDIGYLTDEAGADLATLRCACQLQPAGAECTGSTTRIWPEPSMSLRASQPSIRTVLGLVRGTAPVWSVGALQKPCSVKGTWADPVRQQPSADSVHRTLDTHKQVYAPLALQNT